MNKEQIYQSITKEIGAEFVKKEEPMSKHTSFKIGGVADIFVTINNENQLKAILKIAKENNIPLTVIGNGTNLLVKDNGIRGIVIKINLDKIEVQKHEEKATIYVGAGVKNGTLAQILLKEEIAGFEFAAGIPGTMGGAIYMNAGAYGGEMKEIIAEVNYMDINGQIHTYTNEQCKFDYRRSIFFEKNVIITSAKIQLPIGSKEKIKEKMEENAQNRAEKQPIQIPSAGSTFKRGKDFITAMLIDECGLKGYKVGDAQVSTLHAGFLVNTGNATAKDMLKLIKYVQDTVLEKCGKQIELEVKVIGE